MATTNDLKNGLVLNIDGQLWAVVEFQHVKPGKGGAFVRTRLKNIKTQRVLDRTFRSGEKLEDIRLERKTLQCLYKTESEYVFMDMHSYDQIHVQEDVVGDAANFLKDGMEVDISFHGDTPLGVDLPIFVELAIAHTEPGVKGDTASGGGKPATLETGAAIQVPLFLNEGDRVRVDTRTGTYVERVK